MLHRVDFRDHGMFTLGGMHPLTFLTVPESLYRWMTRDSGRPNRHLIDWYEARLATLGYDARLLVTRLVDGSEINPHPDRTLLEPPRKALQLAGSIRPQVQPRFRELTDHDLSIAGIFIVHIPYRGAVMTDTLSGVVPVGIQNAGAMLPMVRDGRLRGIGITSLKRSGNAPDLPTVAEQGFPGFEATSWFALLAPAGTPPAIIEKVRAESLKVLADPEMLKRFAAMGLDTVGTTAAEVRAAIERDIPKWAKVIKDAGIKPGN